MAIPNGADKKRPNFLVIVADDLGFSDCGAFGGEIKTPNVDRLANDGLRLTDFHSAAACSPTRAMILTGTDHHIAGIGNLIEWIRTPGSNAPSEDGKPKKYPNLYVQRGRPGYEGYMNESVVAIPEILRENGYQTLMSGKWHLGLKPERAPHARGFERSFSHLPGASNHYLYEPQYEEPMPVFMQTNSPALHIEDGQYVKKMPENWYSSDGYGDKLVSYLSDRESSGETRPFFAYLAFTAPHWPLQAPQECIQQYRGFYDDGPDKLRERRLKRMIELGLMDPKTVAHDVVAFESPEWGIMTPEQQKKSARAMECYAGMVHRIDENIGKVLDKLEQQGELENTVIMFLSDNGAEGAAYEAYPVIATSVIDHINKPGYYDNSLANLGNANSFIWYGPRWAQAATAPSRLFKAYSTEGGTRVPFVIRGPGITRKGIEETFSTVMDITPTILEMAGIEHPGTEWHGKEVAPLRGKSMMTYLAESADRVHEKDFIQGWELCGRAAIRKGNWKANFVPAPRGPDKWELHDLDNDRGETADVSAQHPAVMKELMQLWEKYMLETGVVGVSPELGTVVVPTEEQLTSTGWMEFEYWQPGAIDRPEDFYVDVPNVSKQKLAAR